MSLRVQLREAKRKRRKEEDKEKRKQREELALIREAEAQKAHEAALAAIDGQPASELIRALKPPEAPSHRSASDSLEASGSLRFSVCHCPSAFKSSLKLPDAPSHRSPLDLPETPGNPPHVPGQGSLCPSG